MAAAKCHTMQEIMDSVIGVSLHDVKLKKEIKLIQNKWNFIHNPKATMQLHKVNCQQGVKHQLVELGNHGLDNRYVFIIKKSVCID